MPSAGRNEVSMKITACGVCGSNLHLIEGDWLRYGIPIKLPIIPGHELVRFVESIGSEARTFGKGERRPGIPKRKRF